jgi:hypothetical protein
VSIAAAPEPSPAAFLPGRIATVWGVAGVVALYRLAFTIAVAVAAPPLGMDNIADNVWAQHLRLVYQLRQPPLFEWLLWPVQQLTGPTALSFLVVKDGLVVLAAAFLFGAATSAIRDRRLAAIAVFSYALYYNIAWTMLERLTQSSLLLCCCAATAWTFARALRTRRALDYALLGLAIGAGLLAKFNFALFGLSLIAAALSEPLLRRRLRLSGMAIALATAAVVVSPFVYGLVAGDQPLVSSAVGIMQGGDKAPYLARAVTGLGRLAVALLEFSLALAPLAAVVFWKPVRSGQLPAVDDERAALARMYGKTSLIAAAVAVVGVIATGSVYIRDWHVLPVFVTLPLWLFARIERGGASPLRLKLWTGAIAVVVVACAAIRAGAELAPDASFCGHCGALKPYPALAEDLRRLGGANATLIGLDPYTAGNLRAQLPGARVMMADFREPKPPGPDRPCFAVWELEGPPVPLELRLASAGYSPADLKGAGPEEIVNHFWRRQWLSGFGRSTTWGIRSLDPAASACR